MARTPVLHSPASFNPISLSIPLSPYPPTPFHIPLSPLSALAFCRRRTIIQFALEFPTRSDCTSTSFTVIRGCNPATDWIPRTHRPARNPLQDRCRSHSFSGGNLVGVSVQRTPSRLVNQPAIQLRLECAAACVGLVLAQ